MQRSHDLFDWLQTIAIITAPAATAVIAIYTIRRQEHSARGQWLQEQRRDAYVEFLSATRRAYEAVSGRAWSVGARGPTTPDERQAIETGLNAAEHAAAIVKIVGPDDIADLATAVLARLRLDRLFYSPTRDSQLPDRRERVLQLAEETQTPGFVSALRQALIGQIDHNAYAEAHARYRLDQVWDRFTSRAHEILGE